MDFFIANAHAAGPAASASLESFLPLIVIAVLFYFLIIRPQSKRVKEHKNMVQGLQKGDKVVTNGGLLGRICGVEDDVVTLEIAKDVEIQVQRQAVASLQASKEAVKAK